MDQKKKCASCGYEAKDDAKFCPRCGSNQFLSAQPQSAPGGMKRCAGCGLDMRQDAKFCPRCGGQTFHILRPHCPVCGAVLADGATFCGNCGARLAPAAQQPAQPPVQPPKPVQPQPAQPQKQPQQARPAQKRKKKSAAWVWFLVIPALLAALVVGLDMLDMLSLPQLDMEHWYTSAPGTTQGWEEEPTDPATYPTAKPTQPAAKPTDPPTQPPTEPPTEPQDSQPTKPSMKPTEPPTQPPTEPPTQPPTEPVDTNPVPVELRENLYLNAMGDGYCEEMTGDMMITVIFLNDTISSWDKAGISAAKKQFNSDMTRLEQDAASYGAQLDVQITYLESTISYAYDRNDSIAAWAYSALNKVGLGDAYSDQTELEAYYSVDNAPVVFVLNREGRAYAMSYSAGNGLEYAVLFGSEPTAFRHELSHIFGAKDFYFPEETIEAADTYLTNSIMMDSAEGTVDPLTAFLIGWTDELHPNAEAFLQATNHITEEYLEQMREQDQLTGYGTKKFQNGNVYTGYMEFGVPHGQGTLTETDGTVTTGTFVQGNITGYAETTRRNGYSYKGYWKDNKPHGTGTAVYAGGDTYTGDFANGDRHGTGTYTWTDGSYYTGDWVEGERTGQGTLHSSDGTVYTGGFKKGEYSGYGEITTKSGYSYKGNFKNGRYNGTGTAVYNGGDTYTGDFVDGNRHGTGTYTWTDGAVYTGDWKEGQRTGQGTMTYSNGAVYTGAWKDSKRSGQGTMTWVSGSYYTGQWENDYQNGYGVYYYADYGTRYEGDFVDGKRHGWGTFYYADGTTYTGPWENDVRAD